jgi:hypothetical protein
VKKAVCWVVLWVAVRVVWKAVLLVPSLAACLAVRLAGEWGSLLVGPRVVLLVASWVGLKEL